LWSFAKIGDLTKKGSGGRKTSKLTCNGVFVLRPRWGGGEDVHNASVEEKGGLPKSGGRLRGGGKPCMIRGREKRVNDGGEML